MNTVLAIVGSVLVGLAALLHVYIFVMESIQWSQPATWKRFGLKSQADAETTRPMAFNQGFYNLFLAIGVATGLVLLAAGVASVGLGMIFLAAGSMVAAALVLVLSSPKLARAAAIQGTLPLVGIIFLVLALVVA